MSTTPNDPNQPGHNDPNAGGPSYGSTPSYGESPPGSAPQYGEPTPAYGSAPQPAYGAGAGPGYGTQAAPGKGLAIAALVLGILALLGSWIPVLNVVSILMAIVGIILGGVALSKIRKGTASGRGMALGGIITSVLAILVAVLVLAFFASIFDQVENCADPGLTQEEVNQCVQDELGG